MTLDEVLGGLFPAGHAVQRGPHGTVHGTGQLGGGSEIALIGIVEGTPLGIEAALLLAGHVLAVIKNGGRRPIMMLVDTASQNMARRDELLGLNEYLAHLSKCLVFAGEQGHRTVGILYGHAAAGAFIATALSNQVLVALPGADPFVMDLPSIARVTKLPLDTLKDMAKSTSIFAPGLAPLFATGAVTETWDSTNDSASRLAALLARTFDRHDRRDQIGLERGGRKQAAAIAGRVQEEAAKHA
jgi:malonate decarboxylase gamma subunit